MSVSSLASSFPGQACTPLPNGMKVFGFGETWMKKNHKIIIYMFVWKNYILKILLSIDSFIPQTLKGWICEALEKILDCDEYFWTMALLSTLLVLGILFHNILIVSHLFHVHDHILSIYSYVTFHSTYSNLTIVLYISDCFSIRKWYNTCHSHAL
jgi:hypothetical protein